MKKILTIFLATIIYVYPYLIFSQNFNVSEVDASRYPSVIANFSAFNAMGNPYLNLTTNDFEVRENGLLIPSELVNLLCNTDAPYNVVIVVDKSSSMADEVDGQVKWDWAREGVITFVNNVPLGDSSKMALTTFSGRADILCPFTGDKKEILDSLAKIPDIYGGTNFNVAFLDEFAGAINLLKDKSPYYKRAIVFLSDGEHSSITEPLKTDYIVQQLQDYNIQLFAVTLLSGKNSDLETMAKRTGGYYDFVNTKTQLNNLYKSFAESLKFRQQCLLEWKSPEICDDNGTYRQVSIKFKTLSKTVVKDYRAPYSSIVFIEVQQPQYDFDNPNLGSFVDRDIIITPRLRSFTASDIRIVPSGYFEIIDWGDGIGNPPNYDLIMPVDIPRTIKVRFTPKDVKKSRNGTLVIDGLPCPKEISLTGGYHKIQITKPLSGDYASICDSLDIEWTGQEPNSTMDLYYSTNNGVFWNSIAKGIIGNTYRWLSPLESTNLKIKIETSAGFEYQFVKSSGGVNNDFVTSINVNQNGLYYYLSGYYNNSIKLENTTLTSRGKEDFFLAKYDSDGNLIWANTGGTINFDDRAYGITTDYLGYIYITGITYKGIRFDNSTPILSKDNTAYMFIAKYNPQGQFVNSAFIGAVPDFEDFNAEGSKIKFEYNVGEQPKIYIEGLYSGEYTDYALGVILPLTGIQKKFTAVYNQNLELTDLFQGSLNVTGYSNLTFNFRGETLYATGNFIGTKKIDKFNIASNGLSDFWVSKYTKIPTSFDISGEFSIVRQAPDFTYHLYDFGDVVFGDSVETILTKRLFNPYNIPVKITSYLIDAIANGDPKNDYTLVNDLTDYTIAPMDSIDLIIKFKPNYTGPRDAWIDFYSDCSEPIRFTLKGNGVCGGKSLDLYDFGDQNLNKLRKDTINCAFVNISNVKLVVSPKIRGTNWSEFSIEIPDYYTVYNGKITVNPNDCLDLIVTFNPNSFGERTANVNFYVEQPCKNSIMLLKGNGISSDVQVSSFDWKERRVKGVYPSTIKLFNNSNGTELLDSIVFEKMPVDGEFSFVFDKNNLPAQILPNSTTSIPVSFNPKDEVSYEATLLFYINSRFEPLKAKLTGAGILPKLTTTWDCGERIQVGESTIANLKLFNPSTSSILKVKEISFESDLPEFKWQNGSNPIDLEIGMESDVTIPVIYSPTQNSTNLNTINILADDYDGTYVDEWKLTKVITNCDGIELDYPKSFDFGNNLICSNNENELTFKNLSKDIDIELDIPASTFSNNQDNIFYLPDLSKILLKGGEATILKVRFEPKLPGNYSTVLQIPNSLNFPIAIDLNGKSDIVYHSSIKDKITVDVGANFTFPIETEIPNLQSNSVNQLNLTILYNPFALQYKENSLKSTLSNWNWNNINYIGNGKLEIQGTGIIPDNGKVELCTIELISLLNDIHSSDVDIITSYECAQTVQHLSLIDINQVCFNDNRIIYRQSNSPFVLKDIAPNPINSIANIEFGIAFDVYTSIILFNSIGEKVLVINEGELQNGNYEYQLNTGNLHSGVYYLNMKAGPFSETKKLLIIK